MRRREFIALLGGAPAALPLYAHSQQAGKVWRIGILDSAPRELNAANMAAFSKRLRELGYAEGQNVIFDYRSSAGRNELLPELISQLVQLKVDILVVRGTPEVVAVRKATSTIPVVMSAVADPVAAGVATSLVQPGGNVTGMSSIVTEMESKRLGILKELLPGLTRIAVLGDYRNSAVRRNWEEMQKAARLLGIGAVRFDVQTAADVSRAFQMAVGEKVEAMQIGVDGTTRPNRRLIVELAATNKLPAIYSAKEFAEDGGLIAYATEYTDLYSRTATFVDKILKGAKPAELPIEQPTKFELVINRKAANALGLAIPDKLLALADDVID